LDSGAGSEGSCKSVRSVGLDIGGLNVGGVFR
jgi:hypothetical protein